MSKYVADNLEVNVMVKWYLPTLGEIIGSTETGLIQQSRQQHSQFHSSQEQAIQQWYGAIATLNEILADQSYSPPHEDLTPLPAMGAPIPIADPINISVTPNPIAVNSHHGPSSPHTCPMVLDGHCIAGFILSGPFPVLVQPNALPRFAQWTLTNDPTQRATPRQLPSAEAFRQAIAPAEMAMTNGQGQPGTITTPPTLSLHPDDPLGAEPFCLVLTPSLSLVLTLSVDGQAQPRCFVSFDPAVVWQSWQALRSRLKVTHPSLLPTLDAIAQQFAPQSPDYRLVADFHQLMMMHVLADQGQETMVATTGQRSYPQKESVMPRNGPPRPYHPLTPSTPDHPKAAHPPVPAEQTRYASKPLNLNRVDRLKLDDVSWQEVAAPSQRFINRTNGVDRDRPQSAPPQRPSAPTTANEVPQPAIGSDVELLKAIAHEVRTPLTTIRTLTRLLLKAKNLEAKVIKRLQQIDRECTKQIDRFGLIFKAVELKTAATNRPTSPLATISLTQMVQQNIDRWQQQAQQRNLTLDVILPQSLPNVMSDPTTLDQVLTGLMDRMTHTLPAGTLIQLSVVPAGHQLKLQFWARPRNPAPPSGSGGKSTSAATSPSGDGPSLDAPSMDRATRELATREPALKSPIDPPRQQPCVPVTPNGTPSIFAPSLQAVGELLMFQPETGNLSLNLDITKNLFQSLGGKLIVRQTPHKGEVLTIFLPLEHPQPSGLSPSVLNDQRFC